MSLADARRAEDRDSGPIDPVDRLEPLEELLADLRRVREQVAVAALEEAAVLH
jgi:hypothetical protein